MKVPAEVKVACLEKWHQARDLIVLCEGEDDEFKEEIYSEWWRTRGLQWCALCIHFRYLDCGYCPLTSGGYCSPEWDAIYKAASELFIPTFETQVPLMLKRLYALEVE